MRRLSTICSPNANRVDIVKITFTEGMNALEIAQLLEENGVCSQEDALNYINSNALDSKYDFLQQLTGDRYYHMEGYLFPDTYEFFKDESPEDAILKLVNNCDRKLTDEIRQEITASGMTIDQVMTLASMIQAEAADEDDMVYDFLRLPQPFEQRRVQWAPPPAIRPDHVLSVTVRGMPFQRTSGRRIRANTTRMKSRDSRPDRFAIPAPRRLTRPYIRRIPTTIISCHDADRNAYYAETLEQHQQNLQKAGLR